MGDFLKVQSDASRVPLNNGGSLVESVDVTEAKALTVEDSGSEFILKAAAGAAITLPALTKGWNAKFVTGLSFATTDWTIVSSSDVIQGQAIVDGAAVAASNENTVSFVATAESLGDYVNISCDGTNWYVNGVGVTAGSITFTAP